MPLNIRSELRKGELNILDAPDGCYAEESAAVCDGCAFELVSGDCMLPSAERICTISRRADGCMVIFKRLE